MRTHVDGTLTPVAGSGNPARRQAVPGPAAALTAPGRRDLSVRALTALGLRLRNVWLPSVGWAIGRTGLTGLAGLTLLGGSAVFLVSTQLPMSAEVQQLRTDLAAARIQTTHGVHAVHHDPLESLGKLPAREEVPDVLGILVQQADAQQLTIDTAKYEVNTSVHGPLVRYEISFPLVGPYPNIRRFLDSTLKVMPAVAVDELSISRKAIADENVQAQLRMTIFARGTP